MLEMPPAAMAAPAEMPPPPMGDQGGEVSMSIPKADFDSLFTMIQQLYGMLEGMKATVDAQEMAVEGGGDLPPMGTDAGAGDIADLEKFAQELSAKGM